MPRDDREFHVPPAPGEAKEIAPGVMWLRFDLPFALNHVNIFLIEDGDGWAAIDAGIGDEATRQAWEAAFAGPLKGSTLTRLIVTHHHPDHIGLAGWLTERFGIPLHMSETEFLTGRYFMDGRNAVHGDFYGDFFRLNGMSEAAAEAISGRGHRYLEMVTGLPPSFLTLDATIPVSIGGRDFQVLKGGGHASDQAMLLSRDAGLFFCADQVLERISPNVSVFAWQPEADPLGAFIRSLESLKRDVPADILALPGHETPMTDTHRRIDQLLAHHRERCDEVAKICEGEPVSAAEIAPKLFKRKLDAHQMSFAFAETLAHVNRMVREGRLEWVEDSGVRRVRLT